MSDCRVSKWFGVEWHDPQGRTVYVSEDDMPCTLTVVFTDGNTRELHMALCGREIAYIDVDGVTYLPAGDAYGS